MRMMGGLTVCVSGGGVGVDSAWEQKKLEAKKMSAYTENSAHNESAVPATRSGLPLCYSHLSAITCAIVTKTNRKARDLHRLRIVC